MNSKYGGTMGYQRLIKTIKSIGGGGGDGELTADSVDSSHIINGSILSTDICNNTITGSKIASGTITSSNILNGTIHNDDIADNIIGVEKLEEYVGETLKKSLNPTGLITIYNRGSSTAWFAFKIYSKDDIGNYNQTYDYPIKLFPQGTAYCYYISNKFDYGINPVLRIRILYNTVNYFACLQGASIGDSSIDVDDSWFDFEDVFFDTNNIFFEVEQV